MEDLSNFHWIAGGVATLITGALAHLHFRILGLERRQDEILEKIRKSADDSARELWAARDKDRDQREKDQEAMSQFRQYVLTHLATKDDFSALETRITGAVRMIMNERQRRGDINGTL